MGVAEVSKRAEFLAQLAGEALAIVLGLWMVFGMGWTEFGPGLVAFGVLGFVATSVRMWKSRDAEAMPAAHGSTAGTRRIEPPPPPGRS